MASFNQEISSIGAFVPTTNVWDISKIKNIDLNSEEGKELFVRLYQTINNIAIVLNMKDTGFYNTYEFNTSSTLYGTSNSSYQPRPLYRTLIICNGLGNATTISTAHNIGINSAYTFTEFEANAFDPVSLKLLPLPYASSNAGDIIEINIDATNINITTASDKTAYTNVWVILKYAKQ